MKSREDIIMDRVLNGEFEVQEHFPEDIQIAVQSFLEASKMMVEEKLDSGRQYTSIVMVVSSTQKLLSITVRVTLYIPQSSNTYCGF